MLKVFATDVIVSKGYENQGAVRFSDDNQSVRFRIGKKVYDKNAENNQRWVNFAVKGFGPIVERVKKMQLKEGSFIHISGKLDEESWVVDQTTGATKSQTVIILEDIDYASGGGSGKKEGQNQQNGSASPAAPAASTTSTPENSPNFEGYSNFGGGSFFDGNTDY